MAKVSAVPPGMHTVIPVLTMKGCAEAIEFYKKAFGAEWTRSTPRSSERPVLGAR
jgi:uncharacterized glyoxalase superfamily protein PhnB